MVQTAGGEPVTHRRGQGPQGPDAPLVRRWPDVRVREEGRGVRPARRREAAAQPDAAAEEGGREARHRTAKEPAAPKDATTAKDEPESFAVGSFSRDGRSAARHQQEGLVRRRRRRRAARDAGAAARQDDEEKNPRHAGARLEPGRPVHLPDLVGARPLGTRPRADRRRDEGDDAARARTPGSIGGSGMSRDGRHVRLHHVRRRPPGRSLRRRRRLRVDASG